MLLTTLQLPALLTWQQSCQDDCRSRKSEQHAYQATGVPLARRCLNTDIVQLHCRNRRLRMKGGQLTQTLGSYHFNCLFSSNDKHAVAKALGLWFLPCGMNSTSGALTGPWDSCLIRASDATSES
jgi:hypothetical protein